MKKTVRQHAVPFPAPAGGGSARRQARRPAQIAQRRRQRDVLHQRDVAVAADGIEGGPRDEQRLVAGGDAGQAGAEVHGRGDQRQPARTSLDAHVEAPPNAPRRARRNPVQRRADQAVGLLGQARVGVQEQQASPRRDRGAGVHLARAPARRRQHAGRRAARPAPPCVAAAAVDDDHFGAAPPQRRQRRQLLATMPRLRSGPGRQWTVRAARQWPSADSSAPPGVEPPTQASSRSGAWAFFQTPATYLLASASVG
jgi:hypothetical protein